VVTIHRTNQKAAAAAAAFLPADPPNAAPACSFASALADGDGRSDLHALDVDRDHRAERRIADVNGLAVGREREPVGYRADRIAPRELQVRQLAWPSSFRSGNA